VERSVTNGLIDDDITITDLNIVQARGICADPCFVLNGSSLATEVRKRNQITFTTFATARKCVFHEIASFLTPWRIVFVCSAHHMSKTGRRSKPRGSLRRCIRIPTAGIIHAAAIIPQNTPYVSTLMNISSSYFVLKSPS
jgi:hypothetical protein